MSMNEYERGRRDAFREAIRHCNRLAFRVKDSQAAGEIFGVAHDIMRIAANLPPDPHPHSNPETTRP